MTSEGPGALARRALRVPSPSGVSRFAEIARPRLPAAVHAALPIAIGGAWALVIRHVQLSGLTDLGLVSVLPRGTILLLLLLNTSFGLALARRPLRSGVPLIHVIVLIVMLYGITTFVEPEPRVSAVYKHVGVMAYIGHYGSVNPGYDAYFNWPGFFALGAMITHAAGFHSPLAFAAWGPILFNLLFLPPLIVIFRWASDDARVTWLGLWAFYSTNWVAQDHISPQAMAFLLWLSMLGALLTWFTPRPGSRRNASHASARQAASFTAAANVAARRLRGSRARHDSQADCFVPADRRHVWRDCHRPPVDARSGAAHRHRPRCVRRPRDPQPSRDHGRADRWRGSPTWPRTSSPATLAN